MTCGVNVHTRSGTHARRRAGERGSPSGGVLGDEFSAVKFELRLTEFSAVKTIGSESRVVLETSYDSVHTIFCSWVVVLSELAAAAPTGAAEQREAQLRSRRDSR